MKSKRKKNIILVVPSLGIGGQEKIAITTADLMSKIFNVTIVVFQENKNNNYKCNHQVINLNIVSKENKIYKIINQVRRAHLLRKIKKKILPIAVFSFGETANLTNVLSRRTKKEKIISSIHGFAEVRKNLLMDLIMKKSDYVISISKAMEYEVKRIYPENKNVIIIENGYNILSKKQVDFYKVERDQYRFVTMGRLEDVKGIDRIIKAFSKISSELDFVKLDIIGEGSKKNQLIELTQKLNIEKKVNFLGYIEDPYKQLIKSGIYVLASRNEGFPNSLIEALNCELPVIAVDCLSGPCEILSKKYDGTRVKDIRYSDFGILIEESENEEIIIDNIYKAMNILVKNKEVRKRLEESAYNRAQSFSLECYSQKIMKLIT